ncbi:hypothetical protein PENTCL1PPCAC_11858, partial [Pristionchus entomophagus]
RMRLRYLLVVLLACVGSQAENNEDKTDTVSRLNTDQYSLPTDVSYILYDVNRGEGFNLRRDVHMRVAIAVKKMREKGVNAVLVLPPWGGLYHWRDRMTGVRWSELFDVPSLNSFVPSIEFDQFLKDAPSPIFDRVVYLQHFQEGWNGEYTMKSEKRPCMDGDQFYEKKDGLWKGWFYGLSDVRARELECVSFQGDADTFADLLAKNYTFQSIFVDRAETILHAEYCGVEYWRARRSMRYSKLLEARAERFIAEEINEEIDAQPLTERWEDEKASRLSKGGAYVCAHWRRRDFVTAYGTGLPSIKGTAKQMTALAKEYGVKKAFIATDADEEEIEELRKHLKITLYTFRPNPEEKLIDGASAIVEQIICSWARAFTGSYVSTFSFRIQEDREIRGFPLETTFRRMCADDVKMHGCEQPAKWKIIY